MKKLKFFLLIVVAVIAVMLFSQCKKSNSCKMRIKCHYSSNGIDVDSTASFAIITFDTVKYLNGDIDTLISRFNVPDIDRLPNDSLYR